VKELSAWWGLDFLKVVRMVFWSCPSRSKARLVSKSRWGWTNDNLMDIILKLSPVLDKNIHQFMKSALVLIENWLTFTNASDR